MQSTDLTAEAVQTLLESEGRTKISHGSGPGASEAWPEADRSVARLCPPFGARGLLLSAGSCTNGRKAEGDRGQRGCDAADAIMKFESLWFIPLRSANKLELWYSSSLSSLSVRTLSRIASQH